MTGYSEIMAYRQIIRIPYIEKGNVVLLINQDTSPEWWLPGLVKKIYHDDTHDPMCVIETVLGNTWVRRLSTLCVTPWIAQNHRYFKNYYCYIN